MEIAAASIASSPWRCPPSTTPCRLCFSRPSYSDCSATGRRRPKVLAVTRKKLERALFSGRSSCLLATASWLPFPSPLQHEQQWPRKQQVLEATLTGMALSAVHLPARHPSVIAKLLFALQDFCKQVPFQEILRAIQAQASGPDLPVHANFAKATWSTSSVSAMLDSLLERHPISYGLLLTLSCAILTFGGGAVFAYFRTYNQKLEDSFWDAWGCVCASGMHLKENTPMERFIGFTLAMLGMLVYSLLMNAINTQFKVHVDYLREGAHSVYERGHIVVCGANDHLHTILKQINKRQEIAFRNGASRTRRQTVLLLSERPRSESDKLVRNLKDLPHLDILTRSGSLGSTMTFLRVSADKARNVVFLANKDDVYEADAEVVLSVLAFRPLFDKFQGTVITEVTKGSTADLLHSLSGNSRLHNVQNLSSKLLVQCSRQPGLRDVYAQLLNYRKHVINLYQYPGLSGLHYQQVRRGMPDSIVCGILRDGKLDFHPKDDLVVRSNDKFLVIAPKGDQREPPKSLVTAQSSLENTQSKTVTKVETKPAAKKERIIMLGWRQDACEMVLEYDDYVGPGSELVILAQASLEERKQVMDRKLTRPLANITLSHKVGNPMSRTDLKNAILGIAPDGDKSDAPPLSVVVVADEKRQIKDSVADNTVIESSKSDKQSAFALLLAEALCKQHKIKISSLVAEFVDKSAGKQMVQSHPSLDYICPHELTGFVTAQVTEDPDLNIIWTELLNSWGNEIYMQDIELYASRSETVSFNELVDRAAMREEVAIGYKRGSNVIINPKMKGSPVRFKPGDALVVIAESQYGKS